MGQVITYGGINVHVKKGFSEKAIRYLQTMAQKMIHHAKGQWIEAIHLSLWPNSLQMEVHIHNNFLTDTDATSRLETFAQIFVSPKSSHYHTFVCLVFALTTEDEQGENNKWEFRSILSIYLGPSPHHS